MHFHFARPSKQNLGKCLSPAVTNREKSSLTLDPIYSLATQDSSAPNGTLNYMGAQKPTFSPPQQGQPALSPPVLQSGNGDSVISHNSSNHPGNTPPLRKGHQTHDPTTTSSCPGELQSEVAINGQEKGAVPQQ